jgi:4-amino-4-deoxy-L-arabinose transferase-like glycosyltransferase
MRFDLEHDWQGNMSTPRARVGERTKTHLLIVLCALWICIGLIGHSPWKPFESNTVSTILTMFETGNYVTPTSASSNAMLNPPLYYVVAAGLSTILSPILPLHDAARISSGVWMLITLLMIGMSGRELWGKGIGRQTSFVFIACIGLILNAHTLMPAVSSLTALAMAFYALGLQKRRPYRASGLLAASLVIGALSTGLIPLLTIISCTLLLPILFQYWRNKSFAAVVGLAYLAAFPVILAWGMLAYYTEPDLFLTWWQTSLNQFQVQHHLAVLNTLAWYAWPALPLAIWGVWRYRAQLLRLNRFQLMLTFFGVTWFFAGFGNDRNEIAALGLLIPLTSMAGGSIETLKRGLAASMNWFGLILFGLMSGGIWLGWLAMMTGSPAKMKERLTYLSGLNKLPFSMTMLIIALAITLIWLSSILRSQQTSRSSATNWAIGMTCVWTLLMTLWLPLIDSARSYQAVMTSLKAAMPAQYACINSQRLGAAQRDLLHYHANLKTYAFETEQQFNCDLLLVQDDKNRDKIMPDDYWTLIWSGKRISDRSESFRLFKRTN